MKAKILLDSNIAIYSVKPDYGNVRQALANYTFSISAISQVEVLGYHNFDPIDKRNLEAMIASMTIYDVDKKVINQAIALKQQKKMSLGDSIIASTALLYGLPLMTRNVGDFAWINGLELINPFDECFFKSKIT